MDITKVEKDENKTPVVLVVDDNQQNLELLQAYLEDMDCQTVPAHDGLQALDIIAKEPPDLILLDGTKLWSNTLWQQKQYHKPQRLFVTYLNHHLTQKHVSYDNLKREI